MIHPLLNKILLSIVVLAFTILSCSNTNSKSRNEQVLNEQSDSINKEDYISKIIHFASVYDPKEDERLRLESSIQPYAIDDSLNNYLSNFSPLELLDNNNITIALGRLLEKKYLTVRNSGLFQPETFPVYNMSILCGNRKSNAFAVNIILRDERGADSGYHTYANTGTDFICVDSIVFKLDEIPQMKNDSIHKICKKLVDENKTGGCK